MAGFGNELLILRGPSGVTDQSSSGFNATYQGGMGVTADTGSGGVSAFDFNGSTHYMTLPPLGISGTSSRSVFAWAKFTAVDSSTVWTLGDKTTGQKFTVRQDSGFLRVEIEGSGFTSTLATPTATWLLIGVTFSGTTLAGSTLWVGNSSQSATGANAVNTTDLAEIGRNNRGTSPTTPMLGRLDDIRAFSRVITSTEISNWYAGGRGYNKPASQRRRAAQRSIRSTF